MAGLRYCTSLGRIFKRMHIAINGWFSGQETTGSGQYLHHLLAHLPQLHAGLRLTLLAPKGIAVPSLPVGVELLSLHLPKLPRQLRKLWWEQVTVPAAARAQDATMLWVPYWAAPLWQPLPVVVTVHDLIPLLLPLYRGGLLQHLYNGLVTYTARRSAAILTVSHASAQDIVRHLGIPGKHVHVVYHGPNQPNRPAHDPAELAAVRAKFQLPARYFLYLGGFDQRKNLATILHSYRRYLELGGDPAVHMVIAGKLPESDTAFQPDPRRLAAAQELGDRVHFCGWVDENEKAALYAQATAFLFPSLYEGFGMPVLEAMAAGAPVITSG
jgi:glycosyltransferase involved in cell wall biosynthesis